MKRTVLITGATSGYGLETAKLLLRREIPKKLPQRLNSMDLQKAIPLTLQSMNSGFSLKKILLGISE